LIGACVLAIVDVGKAVDGCFLDLHLVLLRLVSGCKLFFRELDARAVGRNVCERKSIDELNGLVNRFITDDFSLAKAYVCHEASQHLLNNGAAKVVGSAN
jgi:hypothetical protein